MALAKFRAGLLNHAWKVLLLFAIGIGAGLFFTFIPPSVFMTMPEPWDSFPPPSGYQSVTSIFLNTAEPATTVPYVRTAMATQSYTPGVATLVSTYTAYLKSDTFAQRLIEELGLRVRPEVIPVRIGTRLVPDTNIMEIRVTWDSPETSQLIADTAARILVNSVMRGGIAEEVRTKLREQMEFTRQQMTSIQNDMANMQRDTSLTPDQRATHLEALRAQLLTASEAYSRAVSSQATYPAAIGLEGTNPGMTLDSPRQGRFTPRPWLAMLFGGAAGLALGIGLVMFNQFLNPTIDVTGDLEELLDAPVVSMASTLQLVPRTILGRGDAALARLNSTLVAAVRPGGRAAESVRRLRAQVEVEADRRTVRTLLVTSARHDEGKTTVAANLAIAMAQAGKRVVLVDADLERPGLHRLFGLESTSGLTDLFGWGSANVSPPAAQLVREVPAVPNLYVVPSGPERATQSQTLGVERASDLIEMLSGVADFVIFDAAPASLNADALALASQLDGVLVVARARVTRRDTVRELNDCLALVHAHVIGGVLNGALDHVGVSTGNSRRTPNGSAVSPPASVVLMSPTGEAPTTPMRTDASSAYPDSPTEELPPPSDTTHQIMSSRSSLLRTVGSNTVAQLAAQIAGIGATVAVSALLSRHLGPSGFGQYALIFAYVTLVAAFFADVGLSQIAARDASQATAEIGEILASAATLQLIASVVAYGALLIASGLTLDASEQVGVAVGGVLILLLPLDILAVVFLVRLRLARLAWIGVAAAVAKVFLTWGAVIAGAGLIGLVVTSTVGTCLRYAVLPFAFRDMLPWHTLRPQRRRYRRLLVEIAPLALATSCLSIMAQLPIFFLNWLSIPEQVGFFSAAQKVSTYATAPAAMLTATLYPMFSQLAGTDRPGLGRLSGQSLRFMSLFALPLAMSGLIVGPWTMSLVYGTAFEPAGEPFAVLTVQAAVVCVSTVVAHVLIAMGKQRTVLVGVGIGAAVSVVTCVALGEVLGAVGAAIGLLAGTTAAGIYVLVILQRALDGDLPMRGGSLLGATAVLAACTALASTLMPLPAASILGVMGGAIAAVALKAVDRDDVQVFVEAIRVRRNRRAVSEDADGDRRR